MTKTVGGLGISMDIFFPTGDQNSQLGSGAWSFSPGIMVGLMLSESLSV